MIPQLKGEFKKLLSVRSTFIVSLAVILFTALLMFAMNAKTYETTPSAPVAASSNVQANQPAQPMPKLTSDLPPNQLRNNFENILGVMALMITIVVILLMAHEYRYNTIMHTLTLSNNRSKVLGAKITVSTLYAAVMTALVILVATVGTYAAVEVKGLNLLPQDIDWLYSGGRLLFYGVGLALMGLAIIVLVRNLVASIVAIFILPMAEALAGAVLNSHNFEATKYLPFSALNRVLGQQVSTGEASLTRAMLVFGAWLVGTWAVAWYLFLRRDAN